MARTDIIAKLQRDILSLQGFKKPASGNSAIDLGPINQAFPNQAFPLAAIHELVSFNVEEYTASTGFVAALTSQLMQNKGVIFWIGSSFSIFPPALLQFGIPPEKTFFAAVKNEKDRLWAIEEALKCEGLTAVIGEIRDLDLTSSRRLQLAVEKSRVTGFVLRFSPRLQATTTVARWHIRSLNSQLEEDMPGVGFPRWQVHLQKIRNGRPGSWQMEWAAGEWIPVAQEAILFDAHRKTG